jgi:glycosyltransferase involved in cell wall biosynthesis
MGHSSDLWLGVADAAAKSMRTLRDEGPSVMAVKANYNLRAGLAGFRSKTKSSEARQLVVDWDPVPHRGDWPQHVMLVVPKELELRYRRRLDHRMATAALGHIPVTVTTLGPWHEMRSLVHLSSALVMYQMPWSRPLEKTVQEARRMRIPVVFEACAPLHDSSAAADPGMIAGLTPADRLKAGEECSGFLRSLRLADHVIAGRPALAASLGSHVSGRSFLIPAGFDQTLAASRRGMEWETANHSNGNPRGRAVRQWIGYEAFESRWDPHLGAVTDALITVLARNPEVGLRIVGHPLLSDRLAHLGDQVEVMPTQILGERFRSLSQCDILIAPWAGHRRGDQYDLQTPVTAAMLGIPLVASTGAYADLVDHGRTGLLCDSRSDWIEAMESLLRDEGRRQDLGAGAQMRWCADESPSQAVDTLRLTLAAMAEWGRNR